MNNFMSVDAILLSTPPTPPPSSDTHTHTNTFTPPSLSRPIPIHTYTHVHKWDSCCLCFAFVYCSIFANITPNVLLYMCTMLNITRIKQTSAFEMQSKQVSVCKHQIQFPPPRTEKNNNNSWTLADWTHSNLDEYSTAATTITTTKKCISSNATVDKREMHASVCNRYSDGIRPFG